MHCCHQKFCSKKKTFILFFSFIYLNSETRNELFPPHFPCLPNLLCMSGKFADFCYINYSKFSPPLSGRTARWKKNNNYILRTHSSEIRGLRSTKCSSETLQNLLYFMHKKTHVVFFVFHFVQLYIFTLWMPWSMST